MKKIHKIYAEKKYGTDGCNASSQNTCAGIRKLSSGLSHRIRCNGWSNYHIRFLIKISTASGNNAKGRFRIK
jgi:hypothetical protein